MVIKIHISCELYTLPRRYIFHLRRYIFHLRRYIFHQRRYIFHLRRYIFHLRISDTVLQTSAGSVIKPILTAVFYNNRFIYFLINPRYKYSTNLTKCVLIQHNRDIQNDVYIYGRLVFKSIVT